MKAVLWVITLLGLLPLVALSALHVSAVISSRRAFPQELEGEEESTILYTTHTFQLGHSSRPVAVSPNAWPAILCIIGATCCLVGLTFLIPQQPIHADKEGYKQFEPLLQRVYSSSATHPSLSISARDGKVGLFVMRDEDGWQLSLTENSQNLETIENVKQFFADKGVAPSDTDEFEDEALAGSTTYLEFPVSGNPVADAKTCISVFRDILGITNEEPMTFELEL